MENLVITDVDAINSLREQAFEANDIWKFIDYFSDDMIWMPPGELPLVGKEACRLWAKRFDGLKVEISAIADEVVVAGDWAFDRFVEIQVPVSADGEKSAPHYLQCVWTLRREADGSWEIVHFIWNGNPPPA